MIYGEYPLPNWWVVQELIGTSLGEGQSLWSRSHAPKFIVCELLRLYNDLWGISTSELVGSPGVDRKLIGRRAMLPNLLDLVLFSFLPDLFSLQPRTSMHCSCTWPILSGPNFVCCKRVVSKLLRKRNTSYFQNMFYFSKWY